MGEANQSAASNERSDRNLVRDRSVRELSYALIATAITFVLAIAFYLYVPMLREQMRDEDQNLKHTRVFESEATGGTIRYEFSQVEGGEEHDQAVDHYIQDLEILSRRFERGEFAMVLLPGMTDTEEYAEMRRYQDAFQYEVVRDSEGPELVIRTNNPAARAALHDYLAYLQERWVF